VDLAPGWETRLDAYTDQLAEALRASGWWGSGAMSPSGLRVGRLWRLARDPREKGEPPATESRDSPAHRQGVGDGTSARGLADFEGRTWQGFHHHASLCIAARTFLMAERARLSPPTHGTAFRLAQSAVSSPHPWRRPASKGRAS